MTEESPEETGDSRPRTLDSVDPDDLIKPLPAETQRGLDREEDMLDELVLPGVPKSEAERRKLWFQVPRRARASAIAAGSGTHTAYAAVCTEHLSLNVMLI